MPQLDSALYDCLVSGVAALTVGAALLSTELLPLSHLFMRPSSDRFRLPELRPNRLELTAVLDLDPIKVQVALLDGQLFPCDSPVYAGWVHQWVWGIHPDGRVDHTGVVLALYSWFPPRCSRTPMHEWHRTRGETGDVVAYAANRGGGATAEGGSVPAEGLLALKQPSGGYNTVLLHPGQLSTPRGWFELFAHLCKMVAEFIAPLVEVVIQNLSLFLSLDNEGNFLVIVLLAALQFAPVTLRDTKSSRGPVVAPRAPTLAVRFWSAAVGKLPVHGPKTLLASNVTPARGGYVSAFAAYFACASDGTTPGDGGPPSGDPLLLLLLAGAAMGAVLAVTWLLFGANDKPRGEAPSPPPTPKEVTPPAEPTFPEPVGVGRVAPFPHPYAFPRPAIQLSWSPELLWKLTIFGGIVLGLIVLSGFFGGPEGGDGGAGSTTERGAGSGAGAGNHGGIGNDDGSSGRGGAAKKCVWQKPKRRPPLPARYATAAPAATPTPATPTAVGPVSVGPVSVGPVSVGPVSVGPASAPTASAPTAAPIPTAVEDDNSSVYDENELPPSRSPSPPLQPTPATPTAVAPSPAVPAPAGPASETPSPAGPQPTSPLSDVEGPPPFDFDRFLREVSPTPYAHLTGRQLRDLMAEEMGYGPLETQETQETQEVRESGTVPPGEAKGGDPSSTEPPPPLAQLGA